jgi:3-oxoacyl-[acyl-carrier-protein] synthase-3
MNKHTKIISSGSYLPKKILTNKELESKVDTTDEWITERTGIKERRVADDSESSVDLAYKASIDAINKSGIDKNEIGAIFLATCTPERKFPSTAVLLQNQLNIKDVFSFDINAACTGFVYALDVAKKYIESGQVKYALVVGTEKITSLLDWTDRNTCVLFGDGSGAMIVGASDKPGIIAPDPSPKRTQVFLSVQSKREVIFSVPTTSAYLTCPDSIYFLATSKA